jgi:hypothetical protein
MSDGVNMRDIPWTDPVALAASADRLRDLVKSGGWIDVENTPDDAIYDLLMIARDWFHRRDTPANELAALREQVAGLTKERDEVRAELEAWRATKGPSCPACGHRLRIKLGPTWECTNTADEHPDGFEWTPAMLNLIQQEMEMDG